MIALFFNKTLLAYQKVKRFEAFLPIYINKKIHDKTLQDGEKVI